MGNHGVASNPLTCSFFPKSKCIYPLDQGCPIYRPELIFEGDWVFTDLVCMHWKGGTLGKCTYEGEDHSGFVDEDDIDARYYAGDAE